MSATITDEAAVAVIDQWFQEKIRCGEIARYTPAYNQAADAVADLKDRITALVASTNAPAPVLAAKASATSSNLAATPANIQE